MDGRPVRPAGASGVQLTLFQLLKIIAAAAVAMFCVSPFVQLAERGAIDWPFVLMGAAVGVPMILAIVTLLIGRTGPDKDRLVRLELLVAVGAAIAVVVHPLIVPSPLWSRGITRIALVMTLGLLGCLAFVLLRSLRKTS